MILNCPQCGHTGVNETAGRKPHPIRFCPRCNTVYDQLKDVAGHQPHDRPADAATFYDGLDAARKALHPTPDDEDPA